MRTIIGLRLRRFRQDRRGVSNIIVTALSLIIITLIVSNIVLWSYQMNQLDWEKMQENMNISNVVRITSSFWFVTRNEYTVKQGSRLSGSYLDTQVVDSSYESFRESPPPRALDINATFWIDLLNYPLAYIQSVEIQLRYRVDDTGEKWFLKAYNWTSQRYSDNGFNSTDGQMPASGWNYYAVNLTNKWRSYVRSDGKMLVEVHDQLPDSTRTNIDIDFLGVRAVINGALFTFQNKGSSTTHLVSLWVNNSTNHRHYSIDIFVNSGETLSLQRVDIPLPSGQYILRVITERGTTAIYTGG